MIQSDSLRFGFRLKISTFFQSVGEVSHFLNLYLNSPKENVNQDWYVLIKVCTQVCLLQDGILLSCGEGSSIFISISIFCLLWEFFLICKVLPLCCEILAELLSQKNIGLVINTRSCVRDRHVPGRKIDLAMHLIEKGIVCLLGCLDISGMVYNF